MHNLTVIQHAPLPQTPRPIISIGAGGIVHDAHYPAYRKAGFTVDGIYDSNKERAEWMAQTFGVDTVYNALQETLPELPDGAAVLMQKPMGENLDEARAIRDLCHRKGFVAAVNFQMRYAPYILAARSLIEQGVIGEVHDMEVRVTVYTPWH